MEKGRSREGGGEKERDGYEGGRRGKVKEENGKEREWKSKGVYEGEGGKEGEKGRSNEGEERGQRYVMR